MIAASRPNGGRPPTPPLLGLLPVEPLGVARDERGDDRMLGLPGLQQRMAGALAPPGPPGRLAQELEGALGGARIGVGEADVGVDHADEGEQREIVALGDELGADDEVELALRRRVELAAQGLDPAGKVGRQHERADVREEEGGLLRQPLDPRPAGGQAVDVVALRAEFRPALRHGRNGGRRARRGSGARPARPSNSGIRTDGRTTRQRVSGA